MNTEEKIDKALDMFQLLEEDQKKNGILRDIELSNASNMVLGFMKDLADKSTKNDSNALKYKEGVGVLIKLLKRYIGLYKLIDNYDKRAVYWQMKYEGVRDMEAVQEKILDNAIMFSDKLDKCEQENKSLLKRIQS